MQNRSTDEEIWHDEQGLTIKQKMDLVDFIPSENSNLGFQRRSRGSPESSPETCAAVAGARELGRDADPPAMVGGGAPRV